MQITATRKNDTATLEIQTVSSSANLTVNDATNLAADLSIILSNPNADDIDRHYRVVPSETGARIETSQGRFDIPWRHISTVIAGLCA